MEATSPSALSLLWSFAFFARKDQLSAAHAADASHLLDLMATADASAAGPGAGEVQAEVLAVQCTAGPTG